MEKERADVKRRNTLELLTSRSLSSGRITVMIRVMSIIYHRTTLHPTCLYNPCINSIQVPSVLESTCLTGLYLYFYLTTFRSNPSNVGENHVGDVPLSKKIAAGFTTGALAIAVANPTDLVKVRLQSEGKLAPGVPRRYTGAMDAYAKIVRQEGVAALWTGLGPNVARNAIINAAELASYDQVKQSILKLPGFKDDVVTHILAGLGAGFFAVCVGSPVDVVKSRMMGDPSYTSTIDCFVKTLKNDGPLAFYKGFLPNFARLGSWNVIMFLTLEQVQKVFVRKPGN